MNYIIDETDMSQFEYMNNNVIYENSESVVTGSVRIYRGFNDDELHKITYDDISEWYHRRNPKTMVYLGCSSIDDPILRK